VTFGSTIRIGGLAIATTMLVASCGGGVASSVASATPAGDVPATEAPATDVPPGTSPGGSTTGVISGSIFVTGSSTVEPISTGVAEAFKGVNPGFDFTVEGPGTGDGFKKFCAGEADIADASRRIKDDESKACAAAGIKYLELKIAYDGMSVLTSPANTAIACLSFPDLYALIGPESAGFTKWSDAAALAEELGSNTIFPAADLVITGPGEESGTFDSFVELALDGIAKTRDKIDPATGHTTTRPDYTASANDNAIIDGIAGSDTSLGWVGFAFAEENRDKVSEIEVSKDANGTCIAPDEATISDASYPLSRSLYIYVDTTKAAANAALGAYVDFYLAEGTISKVLETVPYVNLPSEALAQTASTWAARR
jgi:phosphate transport system substrate-binding protein